MDEKDGTQRRLLTQHLSRAYHTLETSQDVSRRRSERSPNAAHEVERTQDRPERLLVRRRCADAGDPEIPERDTELSAFDVGLIKPGGA